MDEPVIEMAFPMATGMLVFGVVTTSDQSALETRPQMDPGVATGHTLVTDFRTGRSDGGQASEMGTCRHEPDANRSQVDERSELSNRLSP